MRKIMLVAAVMALVVTQVWVLSVQAQDGTGTEKPGQGGKGGVGGHTEGAPNIDGKLCVTYMVGSTPVSQCEAFDSFSGETSLDIPGPSVDSASFTVWVGDGTGNPLTFLVGVDELSGDPCANMPVDGSGMVLCQRPGHEEVHRFNAHWNANSANGGHHDKGPGQPGR